MGNRKKKDKKKALKHRFAKNEPDAPGVEPVVLFSPRGEVKMSEVLWDFVRPYDNTWKTEEQLRKLLAVALVAWNAAIEPAPRGEKLIQKTMATLPLDAQADFLSIVVALVERKLQYFADNTRMIIDYKLTMLADGPHLSVISTLNM